MPKHLLTLTKYQNYKKASKRPKAAHNLGRWKPIDDFLLIQNILAVNDLETVHLGTKFSCSFTLKEIKDRWVLLLYNSRISGLAIDAMRQLHSELVQKAEQSCLFSADEEKVLQNICIPYPDIEDFKEILETIGNIFHPSRKPLDLFNYYQKMKKYELLSWQTTDFNELPSFSDAENDLKDHELKRMYEHPVILSEKVLHNRRQMIQIRQLETELEYWTTTFMKPVDGFPRVYPEMDQNTLAILRGSSVKFIMKCPKITFGRNTKENRVDMDLSLEGLADKISRKQGSLELRSADGSFFVTNDGKRPIFVNGEPILRGETCDIRHRSLVEIGDLAFVFLVNMELVEAILKEGF